MSSPVPAPTSRTVLGPGRMPARDLHQPLHLQRPRSRGLVVLRVLQRRVEIGQALEVVIFVGEDEATLVHFRRARVTPYLASVIRRSSDSSVDGRSRCFHGAVWVEPHTQHSCASGTGRRAVVARYRAVIGCAPPAPVAVEQFAPKCFEVDRLAGADALLRGEHREGREAGAVPAEQWLGSPRIACTNSRSCSLWPIDAPSPSPSLRTFRPWTVREPKSSSVATWPLASTVMRSVGKSAEPLSSNVMFATARR